MKTRNDKGFTLVEIAIVLAIFAIIIASVFIMVGGAMQNHRQNQLSQQIISILENTRNYARHVDNSSINLATIDLCNLGLLPKDIGNSNSCTVGTNYTDAVGQTITACAAGGTNTTQCGVGALTNTIAIVPQSLTSATCVALISKLSASVSDLGFTQYIISGNIFQTATATNLNLANIATNCTPAHGTNTVNLELDFGF